MMVELPRRDTGDGDGAWAVLGDWYIEARTGVLQAHKDVL